MGQVKKEQMDQENKVHQAIIQCIEIGAISECENHSGEYIDSLEYSDPEELTAKILEHHPDALNLFDGKDEMNECVREALNSAQEECSSCIKSLDS
jgi:hypothetical protein